MRIYECIVIFHPEAGEEQRREVQDRIQEAVDKRGGEVQKVDDWGKRKLAYVIQKNRSGSMIRVQFQSEPALLGDLDQIFKHTESVLRHMILRIPARFQKTGDEEVAVPATLDAMEDSGRRRRR